MVLNTTANRVSGIEHGAFEICPRLRPGEAIETSDGARDLSQAFVYKFSTELAAEYARRRGADDDSTLPALPKPVAVRCLTTGFVATKMSRLRSMTVGLNWIPSSTVYASRSLQSLACHCGCRLLRNKQTARGGGTGKTTTRDGPMAWLTGAMCAVVDSPTSPFSVGITGIVTTGYAAHTIMVSMRA